MSSDLDGTDAFDKVLDRAIDEAARSKVLQDKVHALELDLSTARRETASARETLDRTVTMHRTKEEAATPKLKALWEAADALSRRAAQSIIKDVVEVSALDKALVAARDLCETNPRSEEEPDATA